MKGFLGRCWRTLWAELAQLVLAKVIKGGERSVHMRVVLP